MCKFNTLAVSIFLMPALFIGIFPIKKGDPAEVLPQDGIYASVSETSRGKSGASPDNGFQTYLPIVLSNTSIGSSGSIFGIDSIVGKLV